MSSIKTFNQKGEILIQIGDSYLSNESIQHSRTHTENISGIEQSKKLTFIKISINKNLFYN